MSTRKGTDAEHSRNQTKNLEAKIAALRAEFENEKIEIEKTLAEDERSAKTLAEDRKTLARLRKADLAPNGRKNL